MDTGNGNGQGHQRMSPAERVARSVELAWRDHLIMRAKFMAQTKAGARIYRVPSRRNDQMTYPVVLETSVGIWSCACTAGQFGQPCGHIGAAAHAEQYIQRAMTEAGQRAQRDYNEFADELERRGY